MKNIKVSPENNPSQALGVDPEYIRSFSSAEAFIKDAKHQGILAEDANQESLLQAAWDKANPKKEATVEKTEADFVQPAGKKK